MSKYFFLTGKVKANTAFAYTAGDTPLSHEILPGVIKKSELPFDLFLKKISIASDGLHVSSDLSGIKNLWLDYQPNNLAWPLMSENMKDVVSRHLTGNEGLSWIKARVFFENMYKLYFIPKFQMKLDVLDENNTLFVPGTDHVIKPVFSLDKIRKYSIFFAPDEFWEITSNLYVSEALKIALQREKILGVDFERASVL